MKECKRIIKIIAIIAAMLLCFNAKANAAELSTTEPIKVASMQDIINAGKGFINEGKLQQEDVNTTTEDAFANALAPVGSILVAVGIIIFLAVLAIMAIKWITAKPDQKAKLQQAFVGYVIAAIVFFGAVGIWNLVRDIMESVESAI